MLWLFVRKKMDKKINEKNVIWQHIAFLQKFLCTFYRTTLMSLSHKNTKTNVKSLSNKILKQTLQEMVGTWRLKRSDSDNKQAL